MDLTEQADGMTRIDGHVDDDGMADFSLTIAARASLTDDNFRF